MSSNSSSSEKLSGRVLAKLCDFQRSSAINAFERLYGKSNHEPTNRFLIADEVGLGKTHVCKGIIALAFDELRSINCNERIDIIYICSNQLIAGQNIDRLNIFEGGIATETDRITLLPIRLNDIEEQGKKTGVNLMSFTPATSLSVRGNLGMKRERALLYFLTKKIWSLDNSLKYQYFFRGNAGGENWPDYLKDFDDAYKIHDGIKSDYDKSLSKVPELKQEFLTLCQFYSTYKSEPSADIASRRSNLIGQLRSRLAEVCIDQLKPELVIVDEFQRFKHILDQDSEEAQLARRLFEFKGIKTLLVSATPYKMCSLDSDESDENHYKDFLKTLDFLSERSPKLDTLKEDLETFRRHLMSWPQSDKDALIKTRDRIQSTLRNYMSRVERVGLTDNLDGMIKTIPHEIYPTSKDLSDFVDFRRLSHATESGGGVEYWKSAPYLLNVMDDYAIRRNIDKKLNTSSGKKSLAAVWNHAKSSSLPFQSISKFDRLDPANPRLRLLSQNYLSAKNPTWKLLWMPPSLPYYLPTGAYADPNLAGLTKALVFSSWRMVPKAIATFSSYEAERQMLGPVAATHGYHGTFAKARLVFKTDDQDSSSTMALRYSCRTLATRIDPLLLGSAGESLQNMVEKCKTIIESLLRETPFAKTSNSGGRTDRRWYLVAQLMLDQHFYPGYPHLWANEILTNSDSDSSDEVDQGVKQQVQSMMQLLEDEGRKLERIPEDLPEVLSYVALAGPGTIAMRAFGRMQNDIPPDVLSKASDLVSEAFRSLYNRSDSTGVIDQAIEKEPYWLKTLHYGAQGNIQAVLDEYFHLIWAKVSDHGQGKTRATLVAEYFHSVLTMKSVVHKLHDLANAIDHEEMDSVSIRCHYALAYGDWDLEGEKDQVRAELVRDAFNSPFHPFILATTSVGQEGLDFHNYCHAIYHWNLPTNPVDLEQREGRINRYKGHVIRKNLAAKMKPSQSTSSQDPWEILFEAAATASKEHNPGQPELEPYWICRDPKYWIERHVPIVPLSREEGALQQLKKNLGLYRAAFGQPRQEDLMSHLDQALGDDDLKGFLKDVLIDLKP